MLKVYVGHGWMKMMVVRPGETPVHEELPGTSIVLTCAGLGQPWLDEQRQEWVLRDGEWHRAGPPPPSIASVD